MKKCVSTLTNWAMEIEQKPLLTIQYPVSPFPRIVKFVAGQTGPLRVEITFPTFLADRCGLGIRFWSMAYTQKCQVPASWNLTRETAGSLSFVSSVLLSGILMLPSWALGLRGIASGGPQMTEPGPYGPLQPSCCISHGLLASRPRMWDKIICLVLAIAVMDFSVVHSWSNSDY